MSRHHRHYTTTQDTFVCRNCGTTVPPAAAGTANRNHCPRCLHSQHVDLTPGDRRNGCRGDMRPVAVSVGADGEWSIIHRCERCGFLRANRIAGDDNEAALLTLAATPLSRLPFPLERFQDHTERMLNR